MSKFPIFFLYSKWLPSTEVLGEAGRSLFPVGEVSVIPAIISAIVPAVSVTHCFVDPINDRGHFSVDSGLVLTRAFVSPGNNSVKHRLVFIVHADKRSARVTLKKSIYLAVLSVGYFKLIRFLFFLFRYFILAYYLTQK